MEPYSVHTSDSIRKATRWQVWLLRLLDVIAITLLVVSVASAQSRTAAIGVIVTVQGPGQSDLIGADAVGFGDTWFGLDVVPEGTTESDAWRISAGGSSEIGLQLETLDDAMVPGVPPYLAVCEAVDRTTTCRRQRGATVRAMGGIGHPEYLVRVERPAAGTGTPSVARAVRLTIAFTAT
jgi:hypothetical protein